jgi:hypothetical protein
MSLLKEVMLIKYVKVEGKKECFKEKVWRNGGSRRFKIRFKKEERNLIVCK